MDWDSLLPCTLLQNAIMMSVHLCTDIAHLAILGASLMHLEKSGHVQRILGHIGGEKPFFFSGF